MCKRLCLRHIRTKPYTPETNGKAERFIQTSLREWAYAQAYKRTRRRAAKMASPLKLASASLELKAAYQQARPSRNNLLAPQLAR